MSESSLVKVSGGKNLDPSLISYASEGVLGVTRDSFKVFFKDPSRRNVFLQTLEVDKIESRYWELYAQSN